MIRRGVASCLMVLLVAAAWPCRAANPEMQARAELKVRLAQLLDQNRAIINREAALRRDLQQAKLRADKERRFSDFLGQKQKSEQRYLAEINYKIDLLDRYLAKGKAAHEKRLRALYLQGLDLSWHWLASADSFSQALERSRSLRLVVDADSRRLQRLQAYSRRLDLLRAEYDKRLEENAQTRVELGESIKRLKERQEAIDGILVKLDKEHKSLADSIDAVRQAEDRLVRTFALDIRYDPAEAPKTVESQRAAAPVDGNIQGSDAGGVNFMARRGAQVRAPWDGQVAFASNIGGWGKVVILDHGDRVHTVMAHLGTVAVEAGQPVAAGDVIGAVGPGGRLFLQVRKNARPVDSADWLRLRP